MSKLPYFNSKTQPHLAQGRIIKLLEKFGVSQINLGENFEAMVINVAFVYEKIPVNVPVNYKKLAELYWPRKSFDNLGGDQLRKLKGAAYAAIEDYLKAMLMMHELDIMSITEVFMPNLVTKDGLRLGDLIQNHLPQVLAGKLLTEGGK